MAEDRPSLRRQNAERTTQRILEAAVELITSRGDAEVTMPEVAEASGISLRTLYRYYPTRQELIDAVATVADQTVATGLPARELTVDDAGPWLVEAWGGLLEHEAFIRAQHTSPNGADIRRARVPLFSEVTASVILRDQPSLGRLPADQLDELVDTVLLLTSSSALFELLDVLSLDVDAAAALAGRAIRDVVDQRVASLDGPVVTFRPLTDDDLPTLHAWLNEPGVVRWWEGDDVTFPAVERDYGSGRDDPDVEHWVAVVDGRDAGWIQCYPITGSPEEADLWAAHGLPATTAGIDYLVGDPADRGRGVGATVIEAFTLGVVFLRHPGWTHAAASPYVANEASWRALARAGFRHVADLDPTDPSDPDGPARLMVAERPTTLLRPRPEQPEQPAPP